MAIQTLDLWTLVRKRPQIDPGDLAEALCAEAKENPNEYRSRLLIRDGLDALKAHWGSDRYSRWLSTCPERESLTRLSEEHFDEVGYPSLRERLMDKTDPAEITQFLLELGRSLRQDLRIDVAGSIALIVPGLIARHTEDIDIVGEVPAPIRENHSLLDELKKSYGLQVGHVQTHYFPTGWQTRATSFGTFGRLQVFMLDVYDVYLSKLFSARRKDIDDLRVLTPQLDKEKLIRRFKDTCGSFLAAPRLAQLAADNWRLLFGEELPS